MIIKYVGSGGDYATWGDALNILSSTADGLTDDAIYYQISDTTETADTLDGIYLNQYTLSAVTSGSNRHNGDPTAGVKINLAADTTLNMRVSYSATSVNGGNIYIDGLYFARSTVNTTADGLLKIGSKSAVSGTFTIKNCIFSGGPNKDKGISLTRTGDIYDIESCKVWGCKLATTSNGIDLTLGTVDVADINYGRHVCDNCTVYNCYDGIVVADAVKNKWTVKNCVSFGNSHYDWNVNASPSNTIISACVAEDNTLAVSAYSAANYTIPLVSANFQSLTDTDNNFLFLNVGTVSANFSATPTSGYDSVSATFTDLSTFYYPSGNTLASAGVAPSNATKDIAGYDLLDANGKYPIGCHITSGNYPIDSWLWDFGDGYTSAVQSPMHIYSSVSAFDVILSAYNSSLTATETKLDYINVYNIKGHIGAFYFGGNEVHFSASAPLTIDAIVLQPTINTVTGQSATISLGTQQLYLTLFQPTIYAVKDIVVDFVGTPRKGTSPLIVDFTANVTFGGNYNNKLKVKQYIWYFDYTNNPTVYETSTSNKISHVYRGAYGTKYSVRLALILEGI